MPPPSAPARRGSRAWRSSRARRRLCCGQQLVGELPRELPRLSQLVVDEVRGRNLHAEVLVPVFARAEVADQRQQRTNLPTLIAEVDTVDVLATGLRSAPPHRLEVVFPVTTACDDTGEALPLQHRRGGLRF